MSISSSKPDSASPRPLANGWLGLRARLGLGLASVALIACLGFALAMHQFFETLEVELQGDAVRQGLDSLVVEYEHGVDVRALEPHLGPVFVSAHPARDPRLPAVLAGLAAGGHRVVHWHGRTYYAGRRDAANGTAIFLMANLEAIHAIESLEDKLTAISVVTLSITLLIALAIAALLSVLILRPVRALAQRLSTYRPGQVSRRIADDYSDRDMHDIATSFDTLMLRIDDVIARERAFTQDASHELRTPLAAAMGATELLMNMRDLPGRARHRAARAHAACERMHRLVAALLFLAREGTWQAQTDAAAVLDDVLGYHREAIDERRIRLITETRPTPLPLPDGVIDCVLHNLIENAVRHTHDAVIAIEVTPERIRVTDDGSGLSEEAKAHIFKREYRTADSPGLGIGLYLVSRICLRMGWQIHADSGPTAGTVIEIRLQSPGPDRD